MRYSENTTWTISAVLDYVVEKLTAVSTALDNVTSSIQIQVIAPNGSSITTGASQPHSVSPDTNGNWTKSLLSP